MLKYLLNGSLAVMLAVVVMVFSTSAVKAVDLKESKTPKAINALLVTGGCCHDYTKQKNIIAEGIQARSKVPIRWTIVQQGGKTTNTKIDVYKKDNWYKGYDIIVHNECFAAVADPIWTARILKAHREGVPALIIHCAMHCYRDKTQEWFKFCGVTSHRHGAHYSFDVKNVAKDNPIMAKFGDSWKTPKGELYLISKVWPTATPLAHAYSKDTKKNEVCIWTNAYGEKKTRVFGTTIGHHNETMTAPKYMDMLTRGFMWAAGRLDEKLLQEGKAISLGSGTGTLKPTPTSPVKTYDFENLAAGKPTMAKGNQAGHLASNAVDGDSETRWCAPDGGSGYWWQVDLAAPQTLTGTRIHWEHAKRYNYKVEGSADGKTWTLLVDKTKQTNTVRQELMRAVMYDFWQLTGGSLHYGRVYPDKPFSVDGQAVKLDAMFRANCAYRIANRYARMGKYRHLNSSLFMLLLTHPRQAANRILYAKKREKGGRYAPGNKKTKEIIRMVEEIAKEEDWQFQLGLKIVETLIDAKLTRRAKGFWKNKQEQYSGVELVKWIQRVKMIRDVNSVRAWGTSLINGYRREHGYGANTEIVGSILTLVEEIISTCDAHNTPLVEFGRTIANMDYYLLFYYNQNQVEEKEN